MKFCVIGVGRFGYHVATTLANNGMEVLAVDSNESIISSIRDYVTQAICMSVADEESLRSIGIEDMETVIVAMGENFAQSILVTALLKQKLKVPKVIARAISQIHRDILKLIGADYVILPEKEMGIRLADTLSLPFNVLLRLNPSFSISQLAAPQIFIGKKIKDLNLATTYQVIFIGKKIEDEIIILNENDKINAGDMLIFAGTNERLEHLTQK
jgi:trk/ktr system potassium uptake protein